MWSEDRARVHELCYQSTIRLSREVEKKCLETFWQVYIAVTLVHFTKTSVCDSLEEKPGPPLSSEFEKHPFIVYPEIH